MKFSSRVPSDLAPNRLAAVLDRLQAGGETFVDLTESNPTRAGLDYPVGLLTPLGGPEGLSYRPDPFGLLSARTAVAADFARRGLTIRPDRIVLTSSTSEAYSLLFKLLCDPGDEALVPRPSYPLFEHLTRLDAVVPVSYPLEYHGRWTIEMDELTRRMSVRTRAILIVNPNNPTGSFAAVPDIERLGSACHTAGIPLVGDEVFTDYALSSDARRTSVLDQQSALAFSLGGLSKSAGLPQVKLGWIGIGGPDEEVDEALKRLAVIADAYLSVATPVQQALPAILRDGAAVRRQIQDRLIANLGRLNAALSVDPSCRVLHADAGWYAVIQVPAIQSEESLVLDLLERDRVLVHPGYFFDFVDEAFLVVSLLPHPDEFASGVERMAHRLQALA